jgi:uncharacterized protein Yka (UPF0111/DUF47 family)
VAGGFAVAAEKKAHLHWFSGIFEPTVDFFELLNLQADKTLEGVEALQEWMKDNSPENGQRVRTLEREADAMKLDVEKKLVISFVTPFDREDIYELSASLDEVINAAKGTVREMEAMQVSAEGTKLLELTDCLVEGTRYVRNAIHSLRKDLSTAQDQAVLARKTDGRSAKIYRVAMNELLEHDDFRRIFRVKEVYKMVLMAAERIDLVGERLLHAIVKMS